MAFNFSTVVDAPVEEVYAWHTRPGAIRRLTPPWMPVQVEREATSLADGVATLRLPGGLKWTAKHQPERFHPPNRFVDRLSTPVVAEVLRWNHTHEFVADGPDRTRVADTVLTSVPHRFLREMFAYRSRQLAGDLAAHEWARRLRPQPLTVAVTGASGMVGRAVCAYLSTGGHGVIRLVRAPGAPDSRLWDPAQPATDLLDGVDAVVHLAGEPIGARFTPAHKEAVRSSRIEPTAKLAGLAEAAGVGTFVSASAIGYYGSDRGDEELTEAAEPGRGFLAELVGGWERSARAAATSSMRVVCLRFGLVQSPTGGVLKQLRPLFATGLGGPIGSGRQWQSWVDLDDLLDIILRALVDERLEGPVNAVAPHPARNSEWTRTLGRVMRRPARLSVPAFGPRLLFGHEGAIELALASQRVVPETLSAAGHRFRHAELEEALRHCLGRTGT